MALIGDMRYLTIGSSTYEIPTGSEYGQPFYFVKGTQTAKTGAWTGVIDAPALYDGMTIAYYLPYAGDGNATLNLTLSDGTTTGAVDCYYTAATRLTTHYGAGSTIILTYWSAGSISVSGTATTNNRWSRCDYDSTITYRLSDYYGLYKAYTALYDYQICLTKDEQYVLPVNTVNNSTAITKTLTTESFNPFGPIYYYNSTTDISAGGNIGTNVLYYQFLADLRYSFNTGTTLTARKAVYLVATLGEGCTATLASNPISQTLPTTEDGYIYIYLGQTYDTYRVELSTKHPIFRYINGALRIFNSSDVDTVRGKVPAINVSVTGSGNAITTGSLSDGTLTLTKGSTFLTGITSSQVTNALGYTPYNSTNPNGYTTNTGTVTKVTVGSDLKVGTTAGGNFTTSGTITHANSVTAQTTQAVYPIKIDAQGHISAYGSAVTIPTVPTNISAFTNDAGYITSADVPEGVSAYTGTISAVSTTASTGTNNGFARGDHVHNITSATIVSALGYTPGTSNLALGSTASTAAAGNHTHTTSLASSTGTSTVSLSAGSKYQITAGGTSVIFTTPSDSDTKVSTAAVTSGTTYYPVVGSNSTAAATKYYDATGITYAGTNGTANGTNGNALLTLGNSTASTTANWKKGTVRLYGTTAYYTDIVSGTPTANRTITLPNATGTLALTSDIPSVPTSAASSTTGISVADHGTTSIGSASNWSAGTASSWTFEQKTIPNVTAAGSGSFTQGSFNGGSGSFSATVTNHVLEYSHTHTAATHGSDSHTHTAPTIGTAIKVQSKSGGSNGTAPSLTVTSTTVVTGKSHTITDNGHTHTLS